MKKSDSTALATKSSSSANSSFLVRKREIENLQIILKTAERCNIACKYCYFFFGDNDTYKYHPPIIKRQTIDRLIKFISDGAESSGIKKVTIGFHGGEPLLQRKIDFDWTCARLQSSLRNIVSLDLVVQTNGLLIDEEWIELFSKYNVRVGISLDGPEKVHDRNRLDHRGLGTHKKVLESLQLTMEAFKSGKLTREPSVLCVIDPHESASDQFVYFKHTLGLKIFDFLLPEGALSGTAGQYGQFLSELFTCWVDEGDPGINLRFFKAIINKFLGQSSFIFPIGNDTVTSIVFKVSSDGRLYPDDVLHNEEWYTPLLDEVTLGEWINSDYFIMMDNLVVPEECALCCWSAVCGGGHPWNRYAPDGSFSRPSNLCEGLKVVYARVYSYLIQIGISEDKLRQLLAI